MEDSIVVPQKIKNSVAVWSSTSTSGNILKIIESWEREIVHGLGNSQKVEAAQVSIKRWMAKQNVINTYSGTLFSLKMEGNSDTCYDIEETWRPYYTKWNKPVIKGQILYDFL